jgi:enoyl-CoA hydratase/carnithine racemase
VPTDPGSLAALVGQAMLVLALVLILGGVVVSLPRLLRVRRRALTLSVQVKAAQAEALGALDRLGERRQETEQILRPMRRLRRWVRHPLSVATVQSFRRKGRRRRSGPG